jgi:hypothetical protein
MRVTTKKYSVSISFCHKLVIFAKTVGCNITILSKNLKILKTHKTSYTGPLCITNSEYEGHNQDIQSFGQFLPQPSDLW